MPSAAARRLYEDQIPSFMSVFHLDAETMADRDLVTVVDPKLVEVEPTCANPSQQRLRPDALPSDPSHRHNDSTSTQNTESADSSPTTTMSTTDSASLSDPSPSSSPDSPVNLMPLSFFTNTTPFSALSTMSSANLPPPDTSNLERPMTSPSPRRPRNMKGLSIQPPFSSSLDTNLVSEPSSPSFIKPKIPAMKRKPSQLSLKTNSTDLNLCRPTLEVPQSPGMPPILQRRALKHSTSSPHMLSGLKSATFGPAGGMTFPAVLERNESGLSELLRPTKPGISSFDSAILEEESPIKAQVANRAALDFEPYREQENEDQKSPSYPDGPIAIYGDNVYLYLEPTAEEASRFDVVINVAREVVNPFTGSPSLNEPPKLLRDADNDITLPDRSEEHTPTTPKANAHMQQPEYIHMPWDHNTDIAVDLMMLCETIEKRTKEGKKVLVHCQQGASRSASLIIAYGLYQNPELTVNDAYYAAQAKSRWISPNMRLMYCLQDFQKEVSKKKLPGSAYKARSGRSPTKHHRLTLSADNIDLAPKEPLTAPLPGDEANSSDSSDTSPTRPRGQSTPNRGEPISPGPSSAPSSFSWIEKEDDKDPGKFGRFNIDGLLSPYQENNRHESLPKPPPSPGFPQLKSIEVQPSFSASSSSGFVPLQLNLPPASPGFGSFDSILKPPPSPGFGAHRFGNGTSLAFGSLNIASSSSPEPKEAVPTVDLPLRERQVAITRAEPDDAALMSPRAETMTNNPLHRLACAEFAGMHFVEVPPTPSEGLFSPRQTMFPRNPFLPFGRPPQNADPRSPPTKGETPIVRSIDEML